MEGAGFAFRLFNATLPLQLSLHPAVRQHGELLPDRERRERPEDQGRPHHNRQTVGPDPNSLRQMPSVDDDQEHRVKTHHRSGDRSDFDEDHPFQRHIHDRRERERRADNQKPQDGNGRRAPPADQIGHQCGGTQRPTRPKVRAINHDGQHRSPSASTSD